MIKFLADFFKDHQGKPLSCIKEITSVGQLRIVRFCGIVDSTTIPAIHEKLDEKAKHYFDRNILLDFKDVTHVDSATLAYIIMWLDKLQAHNRKIGVVNTSQAFNAYLSIDKVASVIHSYKNETEAMVELS